MSPVSWNQFYWASQGIFNLKYQLFMVSNIIGKKNLLQFCFLNITLNDLWKHVPSSCWVSRLMKCFKYIHQGIWNDVYKINGICWQNLWSIHKLFICSWMILFFHISCHSTNKNLVWVFLSGSGDYGSFWALLSCSEQ